MGAVKMYAYTVYGPSSISKYNLTLDNLKGIYSAISLYGKMRQELPDIKLVGSGYSEDGKPIGFDPVDSYNIATPYPLSYYDNYIDSVPLHPINLFLADNIGYSGGVPIITNNIMEYLGGVLLIEMLMNKNNAFYVIDNDNRVMFSRLTGFDWSGLPRELRNIITILNPCSMYGVSKELYDLSLLHIIDSISESKAKDLAQSIVERKSLLAPHITFLKNYIVKYVPTSRKFVAFLPKQLIAIHYNAMVSKSKSTEDILDIEDILNTARGNADYITYLSDLGVEIPYYMVDLLLRDIQTKGYGNKELISKFVDAAYTVTTFLSSYQLFPRRLGVIVAYSEPLEISLKRRIEYMTSKIEEYGLPTFNTSVSDIASVHNIPLLVWLLRNVPEGIMLGDKPIKLISKLYRNLYHLVTSPGLNVVSQEDYDFIFRYPELGNNSEGLDMLKHIIWNLRSKRNEDEGMIALALLKNPYIIIDDELRNKAASLNDNGKYNVEIRKLILQR